MLRRLSFVILCLALCFQSLAASATTPSHCEMMAASQDMPSEPMHDCCDDPAARCQGGQNCGMAAPAGVVSSTRQLPPPDAGHGAPRFETRADPGGTTALIWRPPQTC